jgi:glycosyltransferase involved in cell wall biosynthesis
MQAALVILADSVELTAQANTHRGGAQRLAVAFVRALLAQSRAEQIIFVVRTGRRRALHRALERLDPDGRASVLTFAELATPGTAPQSAVVHCLGASLASAVHLSATVGRASWPVTAMTHDLFESTIFRDLLLVSRIAPSPLIAVACATRAARAAVAAMVAQLPAGPSGKWRPALPVVPHGVEPASQLGGRPDQLMADSPAEARIRLGLPQGAVILLYVGRLSTTSKADLATLLSAFAAMTIERHAVLVLAGGDAGGAEANRLGRLARTLLARDRTKKKTVHILPNLLETRKQLLLRAADIFVSPANSFQESFGLALIEAMMMGLPVIASDWDGYRDIVTHGATGLLVPTTAKRRAVAALGILGPLEDTEWLHAEASRAVRIPVHTLRAALETLAGDDLLRRQLGLAGQSTAARFAIGRMVAKYERLWRLLLSLANRRAAVQVGHGLSYDPALAFANHPTFWEEI